MMITACLSFLQQEVQIKKECGTNIENQPGIWRGARKEGGEVKGLGIVQLLSQVCLMKIAGKNSELHKGVDRRCQPSPPAALMLESILVERCACHQKDPEPDQIWQQRGRCDFKG